MNRTPAEQKAEPRPSGSGSPNRSLTVAALLILLSLGCNSFSLHLLSRDKNDKAIANRPSVGAAVAEPLFVPHTSLCVSVGLRD